MSSGSPPKRLGLKHKDELSNYRPISNLFLISKIIERIVKSRLPDHLASNNLLNPRQSVLSKRHSTETALLYIHDHLINVTGSREILCLSSRSIGRLRHHRPQYLTILSVLFVWHSWHCSKLVEILSVFSLFSCQMQLQFLLPTHWPLRRPPRLSS